MMMNQVFSLARKEMRESFRTVRLYVLLTLIYSTFLQWFIIRNYVSMLASNPEALRMGASLSLMYVALMVIPFFANTMLTRSLVEERIKQSLMPLLATGINPGVVWLTKLLTASAVSYLVALVSVLVDILMIRFYFQLEVVLTVPILVSALFFSPLMALGLLAIMAFLFWTVRQANFVAAFLPVVISLGVWSYVSSRPATEAVLYLILLALVAPPLLVTICTLGISRLRRQHIVGL